MANRHQTSARFITIGQVFGKYTVMDVRSPSSLCRCVCGREKLIRNSFMLAGRVGGCHNCANSRSRSGRRRFVSSLSKELYNYLSSRVRNAIGRCTNPKHQLWKYYGGRGIKVCKKWLDAPGNFVEYLATLEGHADRRLVLDRADNNRGYEPGNIRFVTRSESQQNKGPCGERVYVEY